MKRKLLLFAIIVLTTISYGQTITITGTVKSTETNKPLYSCRVTNTNTNEFFLTDKKGRYSIAANVNDKIIFEFAEHTTQTLTIITGDKVKNVELDLTPEFSLDSKNSNAPLSMNNYWLGAKIGYNFTSNSEDNNFIGAASLNINLLESESTSSKWGVIGNIGNYKFTEEEKDDVEKLAQSMTGLLIGIGYTYEYKKLFGVDKSAGRIFVTSGAKFTKHVDIGVDKETVNFTQSVTSFGLEFERQGFKNGGALTATLSGTMMYFDENQYKAIFGEDESKILAIDATLILPLHENLGVFGNGTFAIDKKPIFSFGLVVKS